MKPISSHSYKGKHHVAEIQLEGVMDGDGLRKLAEISGVHSGRHTEDVGAWWGRKLKAKFDEFDDSSSSNKDR